MTFMVVFYVGYCHNRYQSQLEDVQMIMHSVVDTCMLCRVAFEDKREVLRIWRYLNMAHAAAYVGLANTYSQDNFFMPIVEAHQLLPQEKRMRSEELQAINQANLDEADHRACTMLIVWAFEVIHKESARSGITAPIHRAMNYEVQKEGDAVKRLFAYQYQVMDPAA